MPEAPLVRPYAIVIDPDPKVLDLWKSRAKTTGKTVMTFHSLADFLKKSAGISRETDLFIDAHIGTGSIGCEESKRVYDLGFRRMFLTATDLTAVEVPDWFSMVVSKTPL